MKWELVNMEDVIKKFEKLEDVRKKRLVNKLHTLIENEKSWNTSLVQCLNNICPALPHLNNRPADYLLQKGEDGREEWNAMNLAYTYENSQGGFNYTEENYCKLIDYVNGIYHSPEYQKWLDKQWDEFIDKNYCKMENSPRERDCKGCTSCQSAHAKKLFNMYVSTGNFTSLI